MNYNKREYKSDGWHEITDPDQVRLDAWMNKIDAILIDRTGYGIGYYPDCPYNDWHKLGVSQFWAACLVLDTVWGIYGVNPQTLRQELGI